MRPIHELQRTVAPFKVESDFDPSGDQPQAIAELEERVQHGEQDMVLLGAHGLEGLNLRVDLGRKELVPAGPVPAAAAA